MVDPIPRFRTVLTEEMSIPASVLEGIEQNAAEAADEAAEFAIQSPFTGTSQLEQDIFA